MVAIGLAIITTLSVIAGGGGVALNELQIGATNHAAVRRGPFDRALPGIPIADGPNGTVIANGLFDGPIGPQ